MPLDQASRLRREHPGLLQDVANGNRVFWVGSGISRGLVPMLPELIQNIFRYLQAQIEPGRDDDPHLKTLDGFVERYMPSQAGMFRSDPVAWPVPSLDLFEPLASSYSEILAARVDGHAPDYMFLTAADVVETFSDASIDPGPNHDLLAILISEGVVTEIASGNWDGLIEKAMTRLNDGSMGELSVFVTNDSFRAVHGTAHLYKFHGCAVLASNDPGTYVPFLVGRANDIASWPSEPRFAQVRGRMLSLATTKTTLFLGLSVQDYDLMGTLIGAGFSNPWPWDASSPAYLFSEPALNSTQAGLLEKIYPDDYLSVHAEIDAESALGMYSLDVLVGLTTHVLVDKIRTLSGRSKVLGSNPGRLSASETGAVAIGQAIFESLNDATDLVDAVAHRFSASIRMYVGDLDTHAYQPLFQGTVRQAGTSAQPARDKSPELAAALSVLGLGVHRGRWSVSMPTDSLHKGLFEVESTNSGATSRIAIVRDEVAANDVMSLPAWKTPSQRIALLHMTGSASSTPTRSSARGLGSKRSRGIHDFIWASDTFSGLNDTDSMLDKFAEAIGH